MPYKTTTGDGNVIAIFGDVIEGYYNALHRSDPEAAARLVGLDPTDDSIWLRM